jgi:uncharacterized membrane protein
VRGLFTRTMPFVLGTLLLGALVHVLSVLLLPGLAQDSAAARLARGGTVNQMESWPQTGGSTSPDMPFADPFMVSAVCRFDVSDEPLRLRIPTGDHFMSVLIMTETGRMTLGLTDKAASRRQLDVLLATPAQIRQLETQDPEDEPVQELRVTVSGQRGLVLLKALRPLASDAESVRGVLGRANCRAQHL